MANLATTLREAIRRIARREVYAHTRKAKRTLAQYRREIVQLKRRLYVAEKRLASFEMLQSEGSAEKQQLQTEMQPKFRFSPRWVRSQRKRLGLSAEEYGKLLGVSRLTVYLWEKGKSRPRAALLEALAALRKIGRREARTRLASLANGKPPASS